MLLIVNLILVNQNFVINLWEPIEFNDKVDIKYYYTYNFNYVDLLNNIIFNSTSCDSKTFSLLILKNVLNQSYYSLNEYNLFYLNINFINETILLFFIFSTIYTIFIMKKKLVIIY